MTVNEKNRKSKETKQNKSKILLLGEKVLKEKEAIEAEIYKFLSELPVLLVPGLGQW